ncbi:Conserved_hypothetical protein [Hexamita inflata]|uniref:Uncharacterized protein n=1 Tax=Hexamita inflata TaxID=28002 RepID=A0AA86P5J6_9EUKA|nr:Conserved hypothetical protein [Hexamita inflata]
MSDSDSIHNSTNGVELRDSDLAYKNPSIINNLQKQPSAKPFQKLAPLEPELSDPISDMDIYQLREYARSRNTKIQQLSAEIRDTAYKSELMTELKRVQQQLHTAQTDFTAYKKHQEQTLSEFHSKLSQITPLNCSEDNVLQTVPQIFQNKNSRILVLENELRKKNEELSSIQKQFQTEVQKLSIEQQNDYSAKDETIKQLREQMEKDAALVSQATVLHQQFELESQRINQKYAELEQICIQQQDMIQILELENLVATNMAGTTPMDAVEDALTQSIQWIRADKKAIQYTRKFLTYKQQKDKILEETEPKKTEPKENKENDKEKTFTLKKKNAHVQFAQLPVKPDPEILSKVNEAKEKMKDAAVDLPLEWRRCAGQKDTENAWCWHLEDKKLNLLILRGKLMVKFGAGMVDLMEYLARYIE